MFGSSIVSSRQLLLCAFALLLCGATGQTLSLENFGAVGDGVTDDTVALNSAFSQAPPGATILIPAGRTYAHNNIIQIGVQDLIVTGGGRLLATNEGRSGVWISADRVVMQNIVLEMKSTTTRWYTYESMKLRLTNCRGVVVRGVTIRGSASLGIHVGNTHDFVLDKVVVKNTRAGAIYIAEKSSYGTILQPQAFNSGDSAIVIQSSRTDGGQVNNMVLQSPAVRLGTKGLAFAVLGSRDIVMNDIYAEDSEMAALYISAENSNNAFSVSNVTVNGGRLVRSSKNLAASHGSIMIYNGHPNEVIQNITINDVQSVNTTKSLPYEVGVLSYGSGGVFWVDIRNMKVTGGPSQAFYSQAPLSSYRTFHWIKDGRMLKDLIGYGEAYPTFTPEQYGAIGDGVTDDTVALNSLFSQAPPGAMVRISSGKTYAHNDIVAIRVPALVIKGGGRLLATNEARSGVWINADRVVMENIVLEMKSTTKRWMAYEQMKLRLMNSRGIVVRGVTIEGASAAGIFVGNSHDFTIDRVIVSNTRAAGIYITEGSSSGNILRPQILNSGGDGVAFLSQKSHAVQVSKMFLQSPRVQYCPAGRAYSVVGGRDIVMNDIYAEESDAAALYIAAEPSINSYGVSNVKVNGGVLIRSNQNQAIGHGSIMIYNGQPYDVIENISVNNIRSENTKNSQPFEMGIIMSGSGGVKRIELRDIVTAGGPALILNAQNDLSTLRTERIVQDGRRLSDKVGYTVEWTSAPSFAPTPVPVRVSQGGRKLYVRRGARE